VEIAAVKDRTVVGRRPLDRVRSKAPSHLIPGVALLLQAFDYAADVGGDVWDFAIEISELRHAGLNTSDFRWLVGKGFVAHGRETSLYGAPHRCFCHGQGLTFLPNSALVLTSKGASELRKLLAAAVLRGPGAASPPADAAIHLLIVESRGPRAASTFVPTLADEETPSTFVRRLPVGLKPAWEVRRRELRVGQFLVKKFRVPAANQERILSAFEEEGWPGYIDDPLPMRPEIVPKRRLHNVITRLNGGQLVPVLRFHGNGNGDGIGWQLLPPHSPHENHGAGHASAVSVADSVVEVSFDRSQVGTRSTLE
jgi:hypothetical protein